MTQIAELFNIIASSDAKIIPVDPVTKNPLLKDWPDRATGDFQIIETWFTEKWPKALIGVTTGAASGLWALDIDDKHDGADSLKRLVAIHGALPDTVRYKTPGGYRYVFKWPQGVRLPSRSGDIAPGLDVRGGRADGSSTGQIIVPPSVRADGGRYEWDGREGLWNPADAPAWLLFLAIFNKRERRALAAIGVTGPESLQGVPVAGWHGEARKRLKPASGRPTRPGGALLSTGEAAALERYVRGSVAKECEALADTAPGKRQGAIGNAALAIHGLLKGAELEGLDSTKLEDWAFDQWCEARGSLGDGEHTAEEPQDRWERCREDADPRDLAHTLDSGFDDVSADAAVKAAAEWWERRRSGVPAGSLLERDKDIDLAAIKRRRADALVKGILHRGESAVLYGESRSGKSFIGLDACYHITHGRMWAQRKVKRAPALYVALEGIDGFRERMLAATAAHGSPGEWFARLNLQSVCLNKTDEGLKGVAQIVAAANELAKDCGQPVGLIVVDTHARATAGDDENSTADAMLYAEKRAGEIIRQTGAAVMTVMHTNRAGDLRGSLHSRNAVDVVWKALRNDDATARWLVAEKVKDGQEIPLYDFTLKPVPLGNDDEGDAFGSAVVEATPPDPERKAKKEPKSKAEVRDAYRAVAEREGTPAVPLADVRAEFYRRYDGDGADGADPKKAAEQKRQAWRWASATMPAGLDRYWNEQAGAQWVRPVSRTDPHDEFDPL